MRKIVTPAFLHLTLFHPCWKTVHRFVLPQSHFSHERKAKKIKHQAAINKKGKITLKDLGTSGRFSVDLAAKRLIATAKGEIAILQRENAVTAMG